METEAELDEMLERHQAKIDAGVVSGGPYEIVGRILRFRGDPGWVALFEESATRYMSTPVKSPLTAANLRRIIGDTEQAAELWRVGVEHARERRSQPEVLICAYFLDDDELFEAELANCGKTIRDDWPLDQLRTAYRAHDLDGLRAELARWERKAKRAPIASNAESPSRHDMVEHVQDLIAEVEARAGAAVEPN